MSQNDFNLANQTGSAIRADMNSALQALASASSGATEPTTKYPYQLWADTTTNQLKMNNAAGNVWQVLANFDTVNNRWEPRANVFQALTAAGITFKNSAGTTIGALSDTGTLTLSGPLVSGANQIQEGAPVGITAAATLPVTNASNTFIVSGTTTVTALASLPSGTRVTLILAAATPFTHSASLKMPGGVSFTGASGDVLQMLRNGVNWECVGGVKADGTPWVSGGSSYRTLLEAVTVSTAVVAVDLTAFDHATYSRYQVEVESYKCTNAVPIYMQLSADGGTTFLGGSNYNFTYAGVTTAGAASLAATGPVSYIKSGTTHNSSGSGVLSMEIYNMGDAASFTTLNGITSNTYTPNVTTFAAGSTVVGAHNALRLYTAPGNINEGKFRLYGLT